MADVPTRVPSPDKEALRAVIRRRRRDQYDDEAVRHDAKALAAVAIPHPAFLAARCVASYEPWRSEPDVRELTARLLHRGVDVIVPRLGEAMELAWGAADRPDERLSPEVLARADIVIVPALATDTRGTRLGQGGGWYDRLLGYARDDALVLACVFDDEVLDGDTSPLPVEAHDRPMSGFITPTRLVIFGA